MAAHRVSRQLAAILAADVVGYSRLIGHDEVGTLATMKARRKGLLEPLVARHEGRLFKFTGDGVLVEFTSAVNAVDCAVALQRGMAEANALLPAERRIELRIGIDLGDVVVEGGDLFGDSVNVAARLQEVAQPGAICVAASIYDQVRAKVEYRFDDLGDHRLKNIGLAVHVYQTRPANWSAVALTIPATLDRPSIAVLPFANMSSEPEQEYFSDGITEDIITELSRFRSLFVIARNSSFSFKDKRLRITDVARELGVGYVVEGSVRRAGDRLRITAQLVDAATGNHIWAERYDRDLSDLFAVQDEVARSVASTVSGRVDVAGRDRAVRPSATALKVYALVLRAKALMSKYTKADNAQALACAEQAASLDPTSARAFAHAAWCSFFNYMACWTDARADARAKAYQLARRAVELDVTDSFARCILGLIHLMRREYDEARFEIEKAIELNPNDPDVRRYYGDYLASTGRPDAAIEQIELAKRLNPFDTQWVPWI